MTRSFFWRPGAAALLFALAFAALRTSAAPVMARQEATPAAQYSCDNASPVAATPVMADSGMPSMAGMDMGSPMAGMEMAVEFDQMYIDMMLPHHASIVAMAQAALPRQMAEQMDPSAQVALLCAAEDPNLAFIDLAIPHHQAAIAASQAALDQATHQEIKDFAQKVIEDQEREIAELSAIREEVYGSATPEPVGT